MKRRLALVLMLASAISMAAGDAPVTRKKQASASALVAQASEALFERSQLDRARQLAQQQLQQKPSDVEALFIEMEAAALEADTAAELKAALSLCEGRGAAQMDPRVSIAAARVLELAGNTEDFRAAVPRIQGMLVRRHEPHAAGLRAALLAASEDGLPGLGTEKIAREAGMLTAWRAAGPFGEYGNLQFDEHWAPEHDGLVKPSSDGHAVERFHFADGTFQLPDYFGRNGVFYAGATMTSRGGHFLLRLESPGTLEVLVDGQMALRKDARFQSAPEIAWSTLRLSPGAHRVVVKFLASAAPFRVAFMPDKAGSRARLAAREAAGESGPETAYIAAAQKYWSGDYSGVISDLQGDRGQVSAAAALLIYKAWTHVADDSPEATAMLNAALRAAPEATAAEYELAARAYAADRVDEALQRLQRVVTARPDFLPGQHLMGEMAIRLNWPVLAENALQNELRVHPSCHVMLEEYKFFAGHARYENAQEMRRRLADCAPDTLAYAQGLDQAGEHAEAAKAAEEVIAREPLDRSAREMLVRELALSGQAAKARAAVEELSALAPNSERYRQMAAAAAVNPDALLDPELTRAQQDVRDPFYAGYRRDGIAMVTKTNDRKFSGGPAVMLVNDRVARLWPDGSVSLYVHTLTRVLDRDGIEKYGEVNLPPGAQVLELRTIKPDGAVVEPEITRQKASVSMPSLMAGDAVDAEYVVQYRDGGMAAHAQAFRQVFGSFAAPILYSRFVAIAPASDGSVRVETAPGILPPRTEITGSTRVWTWEKNDIPQSVEEVATAHGDVLAEAALEAEICGGWNEVRDRFRDELVDALRAGPRVERMAAQVRAQDPQARAREIFRRIAKSIRPMGSFNPDEMMSAEETLARGAGNRTLALLAVARAAGLSADLVLARGAGTVVRDPSASLDLYSRPLVKFRFPDGSEAFADAETEGLAFGALPPTMERQDALLVPVLRENAQAETAASAIVSLPVNAEEQSVAQGDVTLEADGTLRAEITIRMGPWRGAQMRSILAGIEPAQRGSFYQQLAMRIFSGADEVTGTVRHEHDPDQPLELVLRCRAPRYVNLGFGAADIDQLVPTLGLKKMYPGARRSFPLFIDTPLVESASFRVHLPTEVSVLQEAPDVSLIGAFGTYTLTVRQPSPTELEIQRSFRIPVQVIAPDHFPQFSAFAAKIDEAERQRITLQKN